MVRKSNRTNRTDRTRTTRRTALKLFGGLAGVGGATALGLDVFTRSALAVEENSFTADDVTLESGDGSVVDIWLQPDLTYSWDGLNSVPNHVTFTVAIESPALDGTFETLGSETDSSIAGTTAGEDSYAFASTLSLMDQSSWTPGQFEPPTESATKRTGPITVTVTAELENADENSPYTDSATADFEVVVSDGAVEFGRDADGDGAGDGLSGSAGTGGSTGDGSTNGGNGNSGTGNGGNGNGNGGNGNSNANG